MTRLPAIVWARRTFCAHRWRCASAWALAICALVTLCGYLLDYPTSGGTLLGLLWGKP